MKRPLCRFNRLCAALSLALACTFCGSVLFAAPVFQYSFPVSWDGTGTIVTDQSAAANNGSTVGTLSLSASVPPGAAAGTQSITTNAGGILTDATQLLSNSLVAAAGGFRYDVSFLWDGTDSDSFGHVEKIVDYAGTESLQITTSAGSAELQMRFDDSVNAVSTTILPNAWYDVTMIFDTQGNPVVGDNLAGVASLIVNGGAPITAPATKTAQGDTLDRPIGIGQLGAGFGYLVGFKGQIYNPSVTLVPEPASLVLLGLAGIVAFVGRIGVTRRN
jgi:hypothetical protein